MTKRTRGRKRKAGARHPCGKIHAPPADVPPAIAKRTELFGAARAKDQRLGRVLGMMEARGVITERQYQGGVAYERLWRSWAMMAGAPARHPVSSDPGSEAELDPDQWARTKASMQAAKDAIVACHPKGLVAAAIDSVVIDDVMPPTDRAFALDALRTGLDALAHFFRVPGEKAVAFVARVA